MRESAQGPRCSTFYPALTVCRVRTETARQQHGASPLGPHQPTSTWHLALVGCRQPSTGRTLRAERPLGSDQYCSPGHLSAKPSSARCWPQRGFFDQTCVVICQFAHRYPVPFLVTVPSCFGGTAPAPWHESQVGLSQCLTPTLAPGWTDDLGQEIQVLHPVVQEVSQDLDVLFWARARNSPSPPGSPLTLSVWSQQSPSPRALQRKPFCGRKW